MSGGPEFNAEREAYNRKDWPGSDSFYPEHLHGATTGRFSGAHPNLSNTPQSDEVGKLAQQLVDEHRKLHHVDPLKPKTGVEMTPGKKYLLLVDVRNQPLEYITKLAEAAPQYEAEFRARGLDVTFLATQWPVQVYELEAADGK